jgi:hypothetical protein
MHLISRPCGGVFCFTVAICPNREVSWGDVRSGFTFYSITRIFEQRIGNRKEETGKRKGETGKRKQKREKGKEDK